MHLLLKRGSCPFWANGHEPLYLLHYLPEIYLKWNGDELAKIGLIIIRWISRFNQFFKALFVRIFFDCVQFWAKSKFLFPSLDLTPIRKFDTYVNFVERLRKSKAMIPTYLHSILVA